jgi:hypothetical protein
VSWIARVVDRLDQIEPNRLLLVNVVLAFLTVIAQGLALFLSDAQADPGAAGVWPYVDVTVAISGLILVSGLLAWARPSSRAAVLRFHAILLVLPGAGALIVAVWWVVNGIPRGNFSWNPVFFAFEVAYPVYLLRRTVLSARTRQLPIVRYGHVLVAALSIVISSGIFWGVFAWSPSALDFADSANPFDRSLRVPKVQAEPAVPEVSEAREKPSGDVVTLLSTSFEVVRGQNSTAAGPLIQAGRLPWGLDPRGRSGQMSANAIPRGNPGDLRYFSNESISAVLLSSHLTGPYAPFLVEGFRSVQLEFWRLSTSNPSETHNCLGSLRVDYRLDQGQWQSKMVFCGRPKSRPPEWRHSVLEFDTAGHRELELRFDYEYPPDNHKDTAAVYLVDDLTVRGYR